MTKIWLDKLPDIFDRLRKRDRFILGHFYGIYGYEKMTEAELAFRLELTKHGVYKAWDAAVSRAKEVCHGIELHTRRRDYVDTRITETKFTTAYDYELMNLLSAWHSGVVADLDAALEELYGEWALYLDE